jgi:hypothetical protein
MNKKKPIGQKLNTKKRNFCNSSFSTCGKFLFSKEKETNE